jgi:hypothetical protein
MTLPARSLSWATDANYPAGSDPWSGQPTKVALTSGEMAAGFVPDTQVPAEKLNDLLNAMASYVDGVADTAALNWTPKFNTEGQPNLDHWGTPPTAGALNVQTAPGIIYTNIEADVLIQFNAAKLFLSYDGVNWVDKGLHGLNVANTPRGFAIGVRSDNITISIVGWENQPSGVIRATDNLGTSWYAAGSLPSGFDGSAAFGGSFRGRFFLCSRSQLYYSDTLTNVVWTRIPTAPLGWNGAPPVGPTCFANSPTECAIGIAASPSVIYSTDGNTWAAAPIPSPASDGVQALHWSSAHGLWIALTTTGGRILTATPGFTTWTERSPVISGTAITDLRAVCSLGRVVVIAGGNGLWVTRDFVNYRRLPVRVTSDGLNADVWSWLVPFNGRIWAGRQCEFGPDDGAEVVMSGTLPAAFTEIGPW